MENQDIPVLVIQLVTNVAGNVIIHLHPIKINIYILYYIYTYMHPESKIHGANMGPTWGRQDPGGPHVGHMKFVIRMAPDYSDKNREPVLKDRWCFLFCGVGYPTGLFQTFNNRTMTNAQGDTMHGANRRSMHEDIQYLNTWQQILNTGRCHNNMVQRVSGCLFKIFSRKFTMF